MFTHLHCTATCFSNRVIINIAGAIVSLVIKPSQHTAASAHAPLPDVFDWMDLIQAPFRDFRGCPRAGARSELSTSLTDGKLPSHY